MSWISDLNAVASDAAGIGSAVANSINAIKLNLPYQTAATGQYYEAAPGQYIPESSAFGSIGGTNGLLVLGLIAAALFAAWKLL